MRNRVEEFAKRVSLEVLSHSFPGASVRWREEQGSGEEDSPDATYDIQVGDPIEAAVEVTSVTSSAILSQESAMKRYASVQPRGSCRRDWHVGLIPEAKVKTALAESHRRLSVLERHGVDTFSMHISPGAVAEDHDDSPELASAMWGLINLGVEWAQITRWKRPGIMFQGGTIEVSPRGRSTLEQIQRELDRDDNLKKLRASRAPEKHLFVVLRRLSGTAWAGMAVSPTEGVLRLPAGVHKVWAAARIPESPGLRLWTFDRSGCYDENLRGDKFVKLGRLLGCY